MNTNTITAVITGRGPTANPPGAITVEADIYEDGALIGSVALLENSDGKPAISGDLEEWTCSALRARILRRHCFKGDTYLTRIEEAVRVAVKANEWREEPPTYLTREHLLDYIADLHSAGKRSLGPWCEQLDDDQARFREDARGRVRRWMKEEARTETPEPRWVRDPPGVNLMLGDSIVASIDPEGGKVRVRALGDWERCGSHLVADEAAASVFITWWCEMHHVEAPALPAASLLTDYEHALLAVL